MSCGRATALVVAVASATSACTPPVERWEGDWKAVDADGPGIDDNEAVRAYIGDLALSFHGKYLTVHTVRGDRVGTYRVLKEQGNRFVLFTTHDGSDAPQTFTLEGDSTLVWRLSKKRSIRFVRD